MGLEALLYAHLTANRSTPGYSIIVGSGDLNQMMEQKLFLDRGGFDARNWDVYPAVATDAEAKRALAAMWRAKVAGWWNMGHLFIQHGACAKQEFEEALRAL
jgi:hypothetical protein